jgi:hypothetical protein
MYAYALAKSTHDKSECTICKRCIPSSVHRLTFTYGNSLPTLRICGMCILRMSHVIDIKPIDKWAQNIS